jgi:hypothetical protein
MKNISLLALGLTCIVTFSWAQKGDSSKNTGHLLGAVSMTNNGISLIPTFSLGKPAAVFDMSLGNGKFSFDPELAFSLQAKPWYFLFWGRYKMINASKFKMNIGAHLGLNFQNLVLPVNGDSMEITNVQRYLAGELSPNYLLTKNISVGLYCLYARGIDAGTIKNTEFITVNANFSNVGIVNQFYMIIVPQVYYLQQDNLHGFYFTSAFTFLRINFPLSLTFIFNKSINTQIVSKMDLIWNMTLIYSFGKKNISI